MTSQMEATNFDMKLLDLQKKLGEEKRAHGDTILQLLSAQAQAQTAESEAAKTRELVAETSLKLDQAREEIRGLRVQAQGAQALAQEAQAKIEDLEAQIAQIKVVEKSQIAIEAQAQELKTAQAKITSLEALVAKARAVFAESEVTANSNLRDHELKVAQAKIENLEVQMAQMKVVEQFQMQAQELKAAQEKIKDLEAQMAQSEKQAQEEIGLLKFEAREQRAQVRELHENHANKQKAKTQKLLVAQAQVKDLESQIALAQEKFRSWRAQTGAHTQELLAAQAKIKDLKAKVQSKPKAPVHIEPKPWAPNPPRWLKNSDRIRRCIFGTSPCPWFGPELLKYFEGIQLELGKSGLKAVDMVQFLDSWLAGSHPNLEKLILDDFRSETADFEKFASSLTRDYNNGSWYRSSTYHLERPSDGRIACVKITEKMFMFIV